ncbi:MAG: hypothetical protein MZU79_00090 [Anaerotruncus sp.]|nr:hypothetical protein [Anaerotruncus sp.]
MALSVMESSALSILLISSTSLMSLAFRSARAAGDSKCGDQPGDPHPQRPKALG